MFTTVERVNIFIRASDRDAHLNVKKHETQLKISPGQSWTTFTVKTIDWAHQTGPMKGA